MFRRKFAILFKQCPQMRVLLSKHFCSGHRDIEKLFVRGDVQKLLREMTHCNMEKIFSPRPVPALNSPRYLFLTDEDLKMTMEKVKRKAEERLVMPPVMNPREDTTEILDVDTAIQGSARDTANLVFTDISLGFTDRNRLIVVREPSGVLRRANRDERYRMNQIYYPVDGRTVDMPKMFEDKHFQEVLDRHDYIFILERICAQLEPDDPLYIQLTHKTYEHIDQSAKYEILQSTRHFGPMIFYLAFNDKIDGVLIDMIDRRLISDGSKLVKLYYILQNREQELTHETDDFKIIKEYVIKDSKRRHYLEVSIRNYEDSITEHQKLQAVADGK